MRHRKAGVKLNRTSSHKDAMFRNMVTSLFKYERIRTTETKAKELRRLADKMISLAKRGDLHARRQALAVIREKEVVHKLFDVAAERFQEINGGYTRVLKLGNRPGDAAPMSIIELVNLDSDKPGKKKAKKAAKAAKAAKTDTAPAAEPVDEEKTGPVSEETVAEPVAAAGVVTEADSPVEAREEAKEVSEEATSGTEQEAASDASETSIPESEEKPEDKKAAPPEAKDRKGSGETS